MLYWNVFCPLSSLPQGTNDTLLNKFKQQHQNSPLFVPTPVMEPAFVLHHFAGRVKYQIKVQGSEGGGQPSLADLADCNRHVESSNWLSTHACFVKCNIP